MKIEGFLKNQIQSSFQVQTWPTLDTLPQSNDRRKKKSTLKLNKINWNWLHFYEPNAINVTLSDLTNRTMLELAIRYTKSMQYKQRTVNPFCKMNEQNTSIYYIWFDSLSFDVNLTEKCTGILSRPFNEFICSLLKSVKFRLFALCNVKDAKWAEKGRLLKWLHSIGFNSKGIFLHKTE